VVAVVADPHLTFAHGGKADFKGEHMAWYNFLSAKNVSLNLFFVHADFHNVHHLVHGSHMQTLAMKVRTALTGQIVTIEFSASAVPPYKALVRDAMGTLIKAVSHGSGGFVFENLKVEMREGKHGLLGSHSNLLSVSTGRWQVEAASKPFPNAAKNPGKAMLNVQLNALYDADRDLVAPHGLIGQSYDGDEFGVDGAQDDYKGKAEVTTKAMAEGAIEGRAVDYRMGSKFATEFRFSRFDAVKAAPRDTNKLSGLRRKYTKQAGGAAVGAAPDVEEERR